MLQKTGSGAKAADTAIQLYSSVWANPPDPGLLSQPLAAVPLLNTDKTQKKSAAALSGPHPQTTVAQTCSELRQKAAEAGC